MGETWVNTEMRAQTGIKSWAGAGHRDLCKGRGVMEGGAVMGTGTRAGVGPRAWLNFEMGLAQGRAGDLGKEVKQGWGWDGAQVRTEGGLSWDLDLGIRWDPGGTGTDLGSGARAGPGPAPRTG